MKPFILMTIFVFSLISCNVSMDDMLDNYYGENQNQLENVTILNPGDEGFTADCMLLDYYNARTDVLFQVAAPGNCSKYKWEILDIKGTQVQFKVYGRDDLLYLWNAKTFDVYVPNSTLEVAIYTLRLTVIGNNEIKYIDDAVLTVYPKN